MGFPERDPEAIEKHTKCAINAWNNNDPEISVDFFIQEELASVERALIRRNAFVKLIIAFIFVMVIAVVAIVIIAVATTSFSNPYQSLTLIVSTVFFCIIAVYLLLKDNIFVVRQVVNFDIVSIEENRLNKALCAYACCPC
jgi:D-alanyl-lipoteichoic acid acyltransferase DltB (MBOAT superfamily)